jgi:hypothetical protein
MAASLAATPEGLAAFCRAKNALARVVIGFSLRWLNFATRRANDGPKLVMFFQCSRVILGNIFVVERLFTFKTLPFPPTSPHQVGRVIR